MAATDAVAAGALAPAKAKRVAGTVIAGHGFQHMYADGFLVLLNPIYDAFGLNPVSAGVLAVIRQSAGGLMSMGGGFFIDLFAGRRGLLLASSLFLMALGYLLVGAAPNYPLLLAALAFGAAGGSFWHPVGLGILSASFPNNRALMMSLHRSSGGVGEVITPLVVAALLAFITWREVLVAGFFLISAVAVVLYVVLARLGIPQTAVQRRGAGVQLRSIGGLFRDRALPVLLLVSGLRGMADRAVVFFLPLFIAQALREVDADVSGVRIAAVVALHITVMSLTAVFIPPLIGMLSDKAGRKPVMLATMAGSVVLLTGLTLVGTVTPLFTVLIAVLGAVRFAVANVTQAASLDIAEGRRLEGSMIGLLWGNNALFGAASPLILGGLIAAMGDDYGVIFPYAAVLNVCAMIAALFLPLRLRPGQAPAS